MDFNTQEGLILVGVVYALIEVIKFLVKNMTNGKKTNYESNLVTELKVKVENLEKLIDRFKEDVTRDVTKIEKKVEDLRNEIHNRRINKTS